MYAPRGECKEPGGCTGTEVGRGWSGGLVVRARAVRFSAPAVQEPTGRYLDYREAGVQSPRAHEVRVAPNVIYYGGGGSVPLTQRIVTMRTPQFVVRNI